MRRRSPYYSGLILWLALTAAGFAVLIWQVPAPWFVLLLGALNFATFIVYGLDKLFAAQHATRIPEYVLYFTAFAGGAAGALAAMQLFRHKTAKTSFQFTLAFIVLLEILFFLAILRPATFNELLSTF